MKRSGRPQGTSYDVKIFPKIEEYHGERVSTYTVRWTVAGFPCRSPHRTYPLADSFRSELVTATRAGEAFDIESGFPVSKTRKQPVATSTYDLALAYVDHKWKAASATYRRDIAKAMTLFTIALVRADSTPYQGIDVRRALREWAFNPRRRASAPGTTQAILAWVARNSPPITVVLDPRTLDGLLTAANQKLSGDLAAGSSQNRRHAIIYNALAFAAHRDLIDHNPIERGGTGKRGGPKGAGKVKARPIKAVDKRSLLNNAQAQAMFADLDRRGPSGERVCLFAKIMYYAGLRPEEVAAIRVEDLELPGKGWGEITVHQPTPEVGRQWTDSGEIRDHRRQNKGREVGDARNAPLHPNLVVAVRAFITEHNLKPGDLLMTGARSGKALSGVTIRKYWALARLAMLGEDVNAKGGKVERVVRTMTAKRIYDLRHTCLTNWLNSGTPPAEVAEWAGNSVPVLLATYVKCIEGKRTAYLRLIEESLSTAEAATGSEPAGGGEGA